MTQTANHSEQLEVKNLQQVLALCEDKMTEVNYILRHNLNSEVVLINQIAEYIISNGGKRLRPILLLLAAKAVSYEGHDDVHLAAIIELIHTATLLHDDVVDESEMRRGNKTSHEIWGNSASVLVGDFLYSKSFQMMVKVNDMMVMSILSDATNKISEGEVQQLLNVGRIDVNEEEYFTVINNKTAKLFEAGCELAAIITQESETMRANLATYGKNLGIAFQIADDLLDYTSNEKDIGKNMGDDLSEGKLTLPLIYLLNNGTTEQKELISSALKDQSLSYLERIQNEIKQSDALKYTQETAKHYASLAQNSLQSIPDSIYKQALMYLCDYAWKRDL